MSARIRLYLMFSIFMVLLLNLNGKAASLTPPSDGTDAFGGQDGFGYSWADNNETFGPAYRWIDISSNGTGISSRAIDLGFNFPYYGYTYRYAKVNEHGFITLDTLSTGVDHRYEIPSPEFPNRLICVLYDEDHMNASGGFMLYRLIHPDSLVIQWRVRKMASVTMVNFQAILTSNGNIVFQYQNVAPDNSTNAIGIENHLGTVGLQITNGAPFATAGKAIRITYPAVSVRAPTPYCWARNVAVTTHISWVAGDSAATFDLYFSNDSVAVDSRNPSALVGENMSVCSYVPPTALQEGAMFFWRVIVHGANGRIVAFPTWSFSTTGAPMTGTRTVGGLAPDFPSVIDAVAMVKQLGVGPGGVTFLIRPGRYYGQIVVTEIPGASQTNQVVFRAEQDTVLAYCQGVAIGNTNSVIKFHGCDWVTFDGICVADSISLNYRYNAYGYHITNNGTTNGATHNTIKNATISLEKSHALTRGVSITYNGTVSAQTAANSFNRLENLKIYCSVTGVYLGGHSTYRDSCNEVVSTTSDLSDQQRFLINYDSLGTNPEAAAAAGLGVYAANQTNLTIRNIDITGANGSIRTYGIQTTGLWGTNTISGNRIFRNQAMSTTTLDSSYGIRVAGGNNAVFYLNNNMIYQLTADTRSLSPTTAICLSGIYASGSSFTTYIDNNSLLLDQGLVDPADLIYSSAAICLNGGTHFVRNNIVSNQTTSQSGVSSHYGLYLASGTLTANNNCYFIPFGGNGFVGYNGTNRPNLSNWQGAGYDLAGQSGNPGFVLSTIPYDLHIQPASVSLVSNLGMPLPNVETDIEGDARDMSSPDIGADEGDFILASVPEAPQLLFPSNGATAVPVNSSLQWSNGINTDNVDVYISNSQVAVQTLSDSVRVVQASTSSSFTPPLEFIGGVTYYWRVAARNLSSGIVTVSNPASFTTFLPPVGGFKTIGGAAPDYPSFSTAIHDLQLGGVGQGGVVFRVRPGVYVERIVVPDIANASSENRIVFVKETDSVWVTSQGGPGTNDAMITLAGSKWVTFDGINIRCDTTTYYSNEIEWAYFVTNLSGTNGARNNTIQNCAIRMTSTYYAACAIRQTASSVSSNSGSNSYNRYLNLKISKCNYGLYVTGDTAFPDSSTVFGSTEAGVTFAGRTVIGAEGGNDIGGGDVYGVYCNGGQANLTIHDIDVCNTYVRQESANGPSYGIYATNLRGRSQIHGNHLYNIQNTTGDLAGRLYGAYISAYSANDSLLFYNNFIDSLEQSRNIPNYILMLYGVYVPASTGKVFVDNNTILMNPANNGVTNSCITQEGGIVYARNNILYNRCADQPNASHYCLYKSAGTLISDYNLFYVPNAEHGYIGYATSAYASLSNWQSATGQDVHSSFGDPRLVSDNSLPNLHIQLGVATPASNAGTPIPWISTDIDADLRNMSTPDLGADEGEFGVIEENAPSEAALIATSHNSLELSWTDNSQNEAGFYINISTDGSNFTPIRFVGEDVTTCSIGSLSPAARYWFRIYWAQIREGADTTLSQGFANTDGWTLPDSGGVIALHVTGGGFSTAEIDSIGVSRNPTNILYKVREDQSGWFVQANGLLGTTPMLAIASDWEGFAVTGLLRGAELSFHTIAVNSANADGAMSPATVLITNEYPFNGGPDQYGYTYVTSQSQNGPIFSWIDTTGFTLAPLTTSYELEWVDFQGFHFPFYGTSYTRAKFSTNGYLAFGDAQLSLSYINSALPAPVLAGSAIAILWDDLELRAGNRCYYRNFNDTLFVFTYPKANIEFRGDADTASFQILLHQDGRVCMQYRYCSNAVTATIGIQAAINGAANLQYGEPILATLSNWAIEFVPIQPLRLHASINGPDLILAWGQATNTIQGYRIYCSNDPYFTPGPTTLLATVPASQITYIDYNASATRNDRFYVVTSFTKE